MTVADAAIAKKGRKGPARGITEKGAYWVVVDAKIDQRGGENVGQNSSNLEDYFRVRHFRDGTLWAYCETESWHQNEGRHEVRVQCDNALEAETIEDLIVAIQKTWIAAPNTWEEDAHYAVWMSGASRLGMPQLVEQLPGLPLSLPSPDEGDAQ